MIKLEKNQFQDLINVLKSMDKKLNILIAIQKASSPTPKLPPIEEEILKLCNSKNTIKDMMEKAEKNKNQIEITLSRLRSKGMIKSVTVKEKLVYKKI